MYTWCTIYCRFVLYTFFFSPILYTHYFLYFIFPKWKKTDVLVFRFPVYLFRSVYTRLKQFNAAATRTFTRLSTDRVRFFFFFHFFKSKRVREKVAHKSNCRRAAPWILRHLDKRRSLPPYLSTFHKLTFKTIYKNDLLSDVYLRAGLDTGYWFLLHKYKPHAKNTLGYFIYFSSLFVYYLLDKHTRAYTLQ